ncbi:MAG: type II toxin-antitoxin system RelE/ParE family toxin [Verrucomicrobiaceae bacterium]|nr:MAG: type II toxin-antitoxin system RelE/ParE family toxin [Verrucomicrobiaceae bacterium]
MNLRILEEAEVELTDAIARYQSMELGLGVRLKEEVKSTLAWIAGHPETPRLRFLGYRRINLKVFPYYVAYTIQADTVWVLAIAHSARRPEYWIRRSVPR